MAKQATKAGKYGTLRHYQVEYCDVADSCNHWTIRVWRYSVEHVLDAFYQSGDDGWKVTSVKAVPERGIMAHSRELVHQ